MTRKDPSSVDLETAEPATDTSASDTALSRRSLVTRVGAAGLAGIAAALVADRTAFVSAAGPNDRPGVPTEADNVLLVQLMALELAAKELYRAALEGRSDDLAVVIEAMIDNHQAYAQAMAGASGLSADRTNEEVVDANLDDFTGTDDEFFAAAHALEQTAVSTYESLINDWESTDAITLTASIAVVEARHATVFANLLGVDDLDVLFGNAQPPLDLTLDLTGSDA
jgi:rubrerythrin